MYIMYLMEVAVLRCRSDNIRVITRVVKAQDHRISQQLLKLQHSLLCFLRTCVKFIQFQQHLSPITFPVVLEPIVKTNLLQWGTGWDVDAAHGRR